MKTKHSADLQGFKLARSHTRLFGVWCSRYVASPHLNAFILRKKQV